MSKLTNNPTILLIGEFDLPDHIMSGSRVLRCSVDDAKRQQPSFIDSLARVDAVIYRSNCAFTHETLSGASRLRLIIKAGSGIENIDQDYCRAHNITVLNVPGANARSVAELALWQALSMARYGSLLANAAGSYGTELAHKTAVVYGYGHIGQTLAALLKTMGLKVTVCGRRRSNDRRRQLESHGIDWTTNITEALGSADYLFVTASLNPTSRGAIGASQLNQAKPGLRIAVISPAEILDQGSILDGLATGHITAIALDCAWERSEPDQFDQIASLQQKGRLVITPRCGGNTKEALRRVSEAAWVQLQQFFAQHHR